MNYEYINTEYIENINNYKLMIIGTERFIQLLYFLEQERNYKKIKLNIGNFEYDGWKADIFCILDENRVYFKHIRDFDKKEWSNKTLIEQFAFAWDFEETKFNINFDIINNFYKLLNKYDREIYAEIYDEVHCEFW